MITCFGDRWQTPMTDEDLRTSDTVVMELVDGRSSIIAWRSIDTGDEDDGTIAKLQRRSYEHVDGDFDWECLCRDCRLKLEGILDGVTAP